MNRRTFANTTLVLTALLAMSACGSSGKKGSSKSLQRVDDLLDHIERVHVDSELSMERMHDAVDTLNLLASPDFDGDAIEVFGQYVKAVDESEEQADELRDSIEDMEEAAEVVFEQWAADLQSFSNAKMRQRSRQRLEQARDRYMAILNTVEPAQSAFDILNIGLRDQAVYLGHDLNSDALADVGEELRAMSKLVVELDGRFDAAQAAAEKYIHARALPGQLESEVADDAVEQPEPRKRTRTGGKRAAGGGGR